MDCDEGIMMNKWATILMLFLVFVLSACNVSGNTEQCPPPINFDKKDIVGTWTTGIKERNDTIIFREDGTYRQILHVQTPAFDYESDWLPWLLKYSDAGLPYLYLEGMRLCAYWEGADCRIAGGGKDDWYDFCRKEWVQMPNEGILIVLGPPKGMKLPSPAISLFALQRSTEGTRGYEKQTP
jgi:hypothetical protein